jgi:hypothetical protein
MPDLGKKYTCYSCHTKFYDLGKAVPLCPKCGADQRDAEDTPVVTTSRGRRVIEEPIPDDEFTAESEGAPAGEEDEEIVPEPDREEEPEDDDEEEEEY